MYKINNIEGDDEEEPVPSQISPIFDNQGQVRNEACFVSSGSN